MKILFLYPTPPPKLAILSGYAFHQGIGIMSSMFKDKGYETKLFKFYEFNPSRIDKEISEFKPDIIMATATSNQFHHVKEMIEYIKRQPGHWDIPVFLGGVHSIIAPEQAIAIKGIDGICIGEGEDSTIQLIEKIQKKEDYTNIENFWFNKDNKVIKNQLNNLREDLDALPFPDRELFDTQDILDNTGEVEMMTGRGCPYGCTYCINSFLLKRYSGKGKFIRFRSIANVIEELKQIVKKYKNIKIIAFQDDTFTMDKNRLIEFCKIYSDNFDIPFRCNSRADTIDEERLQALQKAGCVELRFGVESGSDKMRNEVLGKKVTTEQILKAFNLCNKYGITPWAFNMIGIPYETEETIKETIELNKKINSEKVFVSVFQPYPGTPLYDLCKEKGWISGRQVEGYFDNSSVLDQPSVSRKTVAYYHNIFPWVTMMPALAPLMKLLAKIPVSKEKSLYDAIFPLLKKAYELKVVLFERRKNLKKVKK